MSNHHIPRRANRKKQGGKYSGGSVALVLICGLLAVFLLTTSYWGDKLVNEYITPAFSQLIGRAPVQTALPAMSQATAPAVTETPLESIMVEIEATSWYLLQMGSYVDPEQAHEQALHIQNMGAGGYLFEDEQGYTRVFAAAYEDQESLLKVQSQIRSSGFENTAYSLHPDV